MWEVLSVDYNRKISGERVVKNVINNVKPGSIVVFHDSEKASKNMLYVLPRMLKHFSEKGYKFHKIE